MDAREIGRPKTAWKADDYVLDDGQLVWQDNQAYDDGFAAGYEGRAQVLDDSWKYQGWYLRAFASGWESGLDAWYEEITNAH